MKRALALVCSVVLLFSLVACTNETSQAGTSDKTTSVSQGQDMIEDMMENSYIGQVTAIDGTNVTLQLGELSQKERPQTGGDASGQPPQEAGEPADVNADSMPEGKEPPQMEDGERPEMPQNEEGASVPAEDKKGGPMMGGGSGCVAGDETITLDLSNASVTKQAGPQSEEASLEQIAVGDILIVTPDETNASYAVIIQMSSNDKQPMLQADEEQSNSNSTSASE